MKYSVKVIRTEYQVRDFEVEASSPEEAEDIAYNLAPNHLFEAAYGADYEVECVEELNELPVKNTSESSTLS